MMGWYHDAGFGSGGWIAMVVMMTIFWVGVVSVGVVILRGQRTDSTRDRQSHTWNSFGDRRPMDILDERFARGELERDEYEARKSVLHGDRG